MSVRDSFVVVLISLVFSTTVHSSRYKYSLLVYFGFLIGFLRRFIPSDSVLTHMGFNFDPILLVIPLSLLIFLITNRNLNYKLNSLEKLVSLLIILAFLESGNPRQGGLIVGITGWIAYAVPLIFLFLGRSMDSQTLSATMNSVRNAGVGVCIYGLLQVSLGYFSWDQRWFDLVTQNGEYTVLNYGTHRPFSTFSSVGEYAQAIGLASGVVTYQYITKQISRILFVLLSVLFIGNSMLTASRSSLILTTVTILSVYIFQIDHKESFASSRFRFLIVSLSSILLLPLMIKTIPSSVLGSSSTLVDRQIAGLSGNNSGVTPASVHITQTFDALFLSIKSVVGFGVGSISGAQKLNGQVRMNFESDIGNAAYAFGLIGLLLMTFLFAQLYRSVTLSEESRKIGAVLVLLPTVNNWFNPGHYSTVWLIWLSLGGILHGSRK